MKELGPTGVEAGWEWALEYPLEEWIDVAESKIRWRSYVDMAVDLLKLALIKRGWIQSEMPSIPHETTAPPVRSGDA